MTNRKAVLLVTLAILVSSPVSIAGQGLNKKSPAASGRIEPLRVIGGELDGGTVTGQVKQGSRATTFSLTLTKAEMVSGKLRLSGDFALHGASINHQVTATVGGVMSNASNPWPNARQERESVRKSKQEEAKAGEQQQGRAPKSPEAAAQLGQLAQSTQDTARRTPPAPGEKTEQTQSLYAQSEISSACGVLFLRLTLPRRLQGRIGTTSEPLQLGVVLKPFDNQRGEDIVKQICQLNQISKTTNQSASLDQLNRLLTRSKK